MRFKTIITIPKLLGYLGLIPFIVSTGFMIFDQNNAATWQHFLLSYAAVILTFVGALQWSFAMLLPGLTIKQQNFSYIWSITRRLSHGFLYPYQHFKP